MNCLTPFSTVIAAIACASSVAVVRRPEASDRRCGSVQAERTEHFAACQRYQPVPLLLLVGEAHHDRARGQLLTDTTVLVPPSPAAISSRMIASVM